MASALTFFRAIHKDGNKFLSHNIQVTGDDETWVSFVNVETKEKLKQWLHTHSPNKPRKFKQTLSACQKADGISFLGQDRKGVLMVEFIQQARITSHVYCKTHKKTV
jgi:hypothetical protein